MRANLILLLALVVSALLLVTSQYRERRLVMQLEQERDRTRLLNEEYNELLAEQRTFATHAEIRSAALTRLNMRAPGSGGQTIVIREAGR